MLRSLEAVTFDAGNTLLYCDPSPAEIYATHLSRLGRTVLAEDVGPVFAEAWAEMQQDIQPGVDRYNSSPGGERAWWGLFVREVLDRLDHDAPWEPLLEDLYEAFADDGVWQVYPDTLSTLASLSDRGIRLAVISNWDLRLPDILRSLDLSGYFDTITVSAIEGVEKPRAEIFHRTMDAMKISPNEALHVGDSPLEDYTGAKGAGLNALLIDRKGLFADSEYRRISSLSEILNLLD